MPEIQLRIDQAQLKSDICNGWQTGAKNILAVLPTGGGKSVIVSDIVLDMHRAGAQQVICAHRVELVSQMSMHVADRGIKHRIIAPKQIIGQIIAAHREKYNGYSFINPSSHCTVAAVDTLIARQIELTPWAEQIEQWTIDEAHHVLKLNKWGRAVAMFPRARGLGVTASPTRADGMGLGLHHDGVFDLMCQGPTMRELINIGALTDYEIALPESDFQIDDNDLPASGDFTIKKMREASKRSHIVGDVVTEYARRAFAKRAICFATDVETATEIARRFIEAGVPTAAVSGLTPSITRDKHIKDFRSGKIWVLVNVDLFGEGFDVPAVEVVIMARPTASLAVYLQQFGRALRIMTDKKYGLVIDHVSNWKRHGFPDKNHYWMLDRRDKRAKQEKDPEDIELTACRNCSRPYERFHVCCPHCGHTPELTPVERQSIQTIDGDLVLLDRDMLAQMRAAMILESAASIAQRAGYAGGPMAAAGMAARQIERIGAQKELSETIALWAGLQRHQGRPDQESYKRFFLTTGIDVLSALALPRKEMAHLTCKIQEWMKQKGNA